MNMFTYRPPGPRPRRARLGRALAQGFRVGRIFFLAVELLGTALLTDFFIGWGAHPAAAILRGLIFAAAFAMPAGALTFRVAFGVECVRPSEGSHGAS